MATETYQIKIQQKGARAVRREIAAIGGAAKGTTRSLNSLQNMLATVTGALGIGILQQYADEYTNLITKLDIATSSTVELTRAEEKLFDVSNRTRQSFASTADLYGRLERSTRELGLSQDNLLQITETVNKAIALSGASTQAANAAILQLGQGMAAGVLRGDELNSVLEQAPRLAEAIAAGMGVAVGSLKTLGEQGKISTTEVVNALASQTGVIDEEFGQVRKTIASSFTVLRNNLVRTVGVLDQTYGISAKVAERIEWLANNLDKVAAAAVSAATGLALLYAPSLLRGLGATVASVLRLNVALLANPLVAVGAAIIAVTAYFWQLNPVVDQAGDTMIRFRDYAMAAFALVQPAIEAFTNYVTSTLGPALEATIEFFRNIDWESILSGAASVFNAVVDAIIFMRNAFNISLDAMIEGTDILINALQPLWDAFAVLGSVVSIAFNDINQKVNESFGGWLGLLKEFANRLLGAFVGGFNAAGVIVIEFAKNFKAVFKDIGNYTEATWSGIVAAISGGDFVEAFQQVRSESTGVFSDIGKAGIKTFKDLFSADYVGGLSDALETGFNEYVAYVERLGATEGLGEDHAANLIKLFNQVRQSAIENARARVEAEKGAQDEIERTNVMLKDQSAAFSTQQLEDFTEKLFQMKEELQGFRPTWEGQMELIDRWKMQNLAAVDETWERWKEYADLVYAVTEEKVNAAWRSQLETMGTVSAGFELALLNMEDRANDVGSAIEKGMGSAVNAVSKELLNLARTGEFSLAGMVASVANAVAQIAAQMLALQAIVLAMRALGIGLPALPTAGVGASGYIPPQVGGVVPQADGGAWSGGVQMFANGGSFTNGVVSEPTNFAMRGNKMGLMGEAGPEAIMPLTRGKDGKLGVAATGSGSEQPSNVNVYIVSSEEEAAERMAQNPDAVNILRKAMDKEEL